MNYDIPYRYPSAYKLPIHNFLTNKSDDSVLRCPSNSNSRKMRIMAKWKGDVIVAKYNPDYGDVLDVLYDQAKSKSIYVCKTDKKFLTKADLEIGQIMGDLGF